MGQRWPAYRTLASGMYQLLMPKDQGRQLHCRLCLGLFGCGSAKAQQLRLNILHLRTGVLQWPVRGSAHKVKQIRP